ncbi:uncharacterized protein PHA67_019039 [Liasis olivaceus]
MLQSFSSMFGSPGRKPNSRVATPRGRSSVAELVIRYQNIFDGVKSSSADQKTKTWEKSFSKKSTAARPGGALPIPPSRDPAVMNKQSTEKLALQQASPSPTKGKDVSQTSSVSRRATSSPNNVGNLTRPSAFQLTKTGNKMETLHHPKFRFQPRIEHPVSLSSTDRSEEQGAWAPRVHNGDSGREEAPCIRSNVAAPSTKLTLAYTARPVNNCE